MKTYELLATKYDTPEKVKTVNTLLHKKTPIQVMEMYIQRISNHHDLELSDYFFLLSEIQTLSKPLRDLALDISLWLSDSEEKTIHLYKDDPRKAFDYVRKNLAQK